jgi:hypothetical protein
MESGEDTVKILVKMAYPWPRFKWRTSIRQANTVVPTCQMSMYLEIYKQREDCTFICIKRIHKTYNQTKLKLVIRLHSLAI